MEFALAYASPLGPLTLTARCEGLTGLYLRPPTEKEHALGSCCIHLSQGKDWLDRYFAGLAPDPGELTLLPQGSPFRLLIWQQLLQIPHGQTRTYGELAKDAARLLGKEKMSPRAVGGAVGANPISIIIPCHRCVASGGRLGGFGWGPDTKKWLLRHEGGSYDDQ